MAGEEEGSDGGKIAEAEGGNKPGPKDGDSREALLQERKNCEELITRLKYLQADFENQKKRAAKEKLETVLYANEALISDLLSVADGLEAALHKMKEGEERKGIGMIYSNLLSILKGNGLKEIQAAENGAFDPEMHEAIGTDTPSDEKLEGRISKVLQKGFLLNGKVLRFAKVRAYSGGAGGNAQANEGPQSK